jgi:hypothetical protein
VNANFTHDLDKLEHLREVKTIAYKSKTPQQLKKDVGFVNAALRSVIPLNVILLRVLLLSVFLLGVFLLSVILLSVIHLDVILLICFVSLYFCVILLV